MENQQKRVLVVGATPEEVFQKQTVTTLIDLFEDTANTSFTGFAVDPKNSKEVTCIDGFTSVKQRIDTVVSFFLGKGCRFDYVVFDDGVAYEIDNMKILIPTMLELSRVLIIPYNGYTTGFVEDREKANMVSSDVPYPNLPLFPECILVHDPAAAKGEKMPNAVKMDTHECVLVKRFGNEIRKMEDVDKVKVVFRNKNPVYMITKKIDPPISHGAGSGSRGVLAAAAALGLAVFLASFAGSVGS